MQYNWLSGEGAVGVFVVNRKLWFEKQGFNEKMTGWGHMEVEFFRRLRQSAGPVGHDGLRDIYPAVHIHHPIATLGSKPINEWVDKQVFIPQPNWGLKGVKLDEKEFGTC